MFEVEANDSSHYQYKPCILSWCLNTFVNNKSDILFIQFVAYHYLKHDMHSNLPAAKVVALVVADILFLEFMAVMVSSYVMSSSKPVIVYVLSNPLIVREPDGVLHPAVLL